jgi:murein DD-endopeptidase MepM/ murein hydrolase activator NlpD
MLAGAAAGAGLGYPGKASADDGLALTLAGNLVQGGGVVGQTAPGAAITLDRIAIRADESGRFFAGFDRDAPDTAHLGIADAAGRTLRRDLAIAARTYQTQTVAGLARGLDLFEDIPVDDDVASFERSLHGDRATLRRRVLEEMALKRAAFDSRSSQTGFAETFRAPAKGRVSSPWGAQRVLVVSGHRRSSVPHYGVDIAAFSGTPVVAPAGARVVLARRDFYYEGNCIFLDHGQNLISVYLHLSELAVGEGNVVAAGTLIGKVGRSGRATGPHLCWRMKWRGRHIDPSQLVPL